MRQYWFFKLFDSVKESHEVDFAELEITSLFGEVSRIRNFADVLSKTPLKNFTGEAVRIQDVMTYEPSYGRFHGFMGTSENTPDISRMVRRLAYTREIYGIFSEANPRKFLSEHFPGRDSGFTHYTIGNLTLFRFVTNQYYLEKSHYVSRLSRNEDEIRRNVATLLKYPFQELYRIPASVTMAVGKRLQDYFTIREEVSLYLTHMLHPYKGKFHAKMVRSLLNYVLPDEGVAMDNFAGSGTLLVEATLMGLNSVGVEINPLSVLMSNVKSRSLSLRPEELKDAIQSYVSTVKTTLLEHETISSGGTLLIQPKYDRGQLSARKEGIPKSVRQLFGSPHVLDDIMIAQQMLVKLEVDSEIHDFLLLGLSGTVSDLARRTSAEFVQVLESRLYWMYLRIFLFSELNRHLKIHLGKSTTHIGDTRDLKIPADSIDAIVNSPPYSTALDYIRNDLPQLAILGMSESFERLEREMIGNPNLRFYPEELLKEIEGPAEDFQRLPRSAQEMVRQLIRYERKREGLRVYKFFKDMRLSLAEMYRILKVGGRAVIIIGNNHFKLDGEYIEIKNDEVIAEMGEAAGFRRDSRLPLKAQALESQNELPQFPGGIRRWLEKTMSGMIRYETVVVLEKTSRLSKAKPRVS